MLLPFLLRTDKQLRQLLQTGTCITVSWKTLKLPCLCCPKIGLHGLFLHRENATEHTATAMVSFLAVSEAQPLLHFLYTPDLYLWLFPISKSEETITGFPVWEQVFSQHGIVHSCWRKVLWRRRKVLFCWLSPISNKHLEIFGAAIALANGH